jgi:phospholipid/cholesterol/gamma-HCH transport system substrate-binding protein
MKREFKSEAKIGLIVIAAFAVFVWGLNYLKGINLLKPTNQYFVCYHQIDGLVKSSPVMLDGYQVGLVRDIQYQYDNPGNILVEVDLNHSLRLPNGTKAIIQSELLGTPSVSLELGAKGNSMLKSGDTLLAEVAPGMLDELNQGLIADVRRMVCRTDSLMADVQTLINNGDLRQSLQSIQKTSDELALMSVKLNRSMDKLPGLMDNVEELTTTFTKAGQRIGELDVPSLNQTINQLETLSTRLNRTDNSLGMLLNDKSLYLNLNTTATNANALLLDLKASPKRYVHFSLFGPKTKKE